MLEQLELQQDAEHNTVAVLRNHLSPDHSMESRNKSFTRVACILCYIHHLFCAIFIIYFALYSLFVPQSALRLVHSLFQFPDWCDLLLPHSISTIISFPYGHPVGAYVFHFVFPSLISFSLYFPSLMCFRRQLLRRMLPIHLPCFLFNVCRLFLSSLIQCNTSSFLTLSFQLIFSIIFCIIFSILLHHHISKFTRYFWSVFRRGFNLFINKSNILTFQRRNVIWFI